MSSQYDDHLLFYRCVRLAFHISLTPVVVCELVGLEKYSSALSLVFMFRGIASLIAPPVRSNYVQGSLDTPASFQVMGAVQDYTHSFNIPFVISGISFLASSALHFILLAFMRPSKEPKKVKTAVEA